MRLVTWFILADQDTGKIIFGILAFVLWGIGSLASMVKKANEEARRRAISRPPATATRAPAKTDQRMVVGGYAAGAGSRPPPLPSSALQRGKAQVQKRQQVRQAPKFVAQPVRAVAPAPRVQATAPPVSSRPIVEKVSSIAQTNSARTNLAGESACYTTMARAGDVAEAVHSYGAIASTGGAAGRSG